MTAGTLAAIVVHLASRLAYVGGVGAMLRRQEQEHVFTREAGTEAGFRRFRRIASAIMYADGVTFALLCYVTRGTMPVGSRPALLIAAGVLFLVAGVGVKLWAAARLGAGAYYWKNFFDETAPEPLAKPGPYRVFRDPMYTIGNLHMYGLALILHSLPGLAAAAFDQAALMVFHRLVEKPHFERLVNSEK